MAETPKRRLLDRLGPSPTFVAPGCRLTGDVETEGPLLLCGSIRGDGRVGGALSLTKEAHWEGEVHAAAAIIAGRFTGRLVIEGQLEIGASAVIHADIVARAVAIARGAVVDGDMTVTGGQPIVHFDERRHHSHRNEPPGAIAQRDPCAAPGGPAAGSKAAPGGVGHDGAKRRA